MRPRRSWCVPVIGSESQRKSFYLYPSTRSESRRGPPDGDALRKSFEKPKNRDALRKSFVDTGLHRKLHLFLALDRWII